MKVINRFYLVLWVGSLTTLMACSGSSKKTEPTTQAKVEKNPVIPQMSFEGDSAKNRVSLEDVSSTEWSIQSFSSLSTSLKGGDQFYVSNSFNSPAEGTTISECNATGVFAQILLKNPSKLKFASHIPMKINSNGKSSLENIQVLQFGAVVDSATGGCTPTLKWMKPKDEQVALEFLDPLHAKNEVIEKKQKGGSASLRAALVKNETKTGDELHLVYETTGVDMTTISTFVYTAKAQALPTKEVPSVEPVTPLPTLPAPPAVETPESEVIPLMGPPAPEECEPTDPCDH